jgi:macrodomain Ter protein organizer (MatP/YcbG family)
MSKLSVSISYADLERLLSGEHEAALSMKEWIISEFAKKHLKPLFNDERLKSARDAVQKDFDKAVKEAAAEYLAITESWGTTSYKITNRVDQLIRNAVKSTLDEMLPRLVRELVNPEVIAAAVERYVNAEVERRIQQGVSAKFAALVASAAKTAQGDGQ